MNTLPEMQPQSLQVPQQAEPAKHLVSLRETNAVIYPESHEDDMGETTIHYDFISDLFNSLRLFFAQRTDVLIAANLNLYYEKGFPQNYYTPDLMICFGVETRPRNVFKLWEEKQFPQVIFEVASERTWRNDISEKHEFYEEFRVEEYYLIDTEDYLPLPLIAYRREDDRLKRLRLKTDRALSPRLGLEIVHAGTEIKLFDPNKHEYLPTLEKASAKADAAQSEIERLKAELARLKGEN